MPDMNPILDDFTPKVTVTITRNLIIEHLTEIVDEAGAHYVYPHSKAGAAAGNGCHYADLKDGTEVQRWFGSHPPRFGAGDLIGSCIIGRLLYRLNPEILPELVMSSFNYGSSVSTLIDVGFINLEPDALCGKADLEQALSVAQARQDQGSNYGEAVRDALRVIA